MRCFAVLALCLGGALFGVSHADEKAKDKEKARTGSFSRTAGDLNLKIVFKKDKVLEYHVAAGDASCVLTCKYTVEKDVYSMEVTEFTKKGEFPVTKEKGYKFSMKIVGDDKKLTVSDFKGDDVDDGAKQAIEGDYATTTD